MPKRLELPANDIRPRLHYPLYETNLHKLAVWFFRHALRPFMDMQVRGLEHVPARGAAVVVCNHLVDWDVFPLQLALPRMIYYMGKAELFQIPPVHWLFRQLGGFPVYRGERDRWALEHALKILASGQMVAMFPEGTRSRGKGLALAKPGAARLALEANCPLVVVSINGIQNLFKTFPRRAVVEVVIAPPIYPTENDTPLSLTDKIMFTMAANLPPELRGVYAERPAGWMG
ncbi:MAG: 1-acyl-sn-glycerol-3-phosphate acyltransferase [Anaerolineae bacterium]|nr:MAG: 1-acyl-sn-glycerol-3-phosphate acyltransferase [Anaerolineae bacterium]